MKNRKLVSTKFIYHLKFRRKDFVFSIIGSSCEKNTPKLLPSKDSVLKGVSTFYFLCINGFIWRCFFSASAIDCYQCKSTDLDNPFQCNEYMEDSDLKALPCDSVYNAAYCIKQTGRFEGNSVMESLTMNGFWCFQWIDDCTGVSVNFPLVNIFGTKCRISALQKRFFVFVPKIFRRKIFTGHPVQQQLSPELFHFFKLLSSTTWINQCAVTVCFIKKLDVFDGL